MTDPDRVRREFEERFGGRARAFRAPGRINLIGEHTDYNDGFCLPFAIDRDTVVAARPREDRLVRVYAADLGEEATFDLDGRGGTDAAWLRYVLGVARVLEERGLRLAGADLVVSGDVPIGGGLSSSASLEVASGLAMLSLAGHRDVDRMELARAGQEAEHRFVGTKSGLMDQLAACYSRAGHALLIDCESYRLEPIPLGVGDWRFVVCDSGVKHELASSEYNLRRQECERAVAAIAEVEPQVRSLRHVTPEMLARYEGRLEEPLLRRARHVVTENARTLEAADALRRGDVAALGEAMVASHRSLQFDYEVSAPELDVLVEAALDGDGAAGARMTGGGFGGCTINVVRAGAIEEFTRRVAERYRREMGLEATIFEVVASDGAAEI